MTHIDQIKALIECGKKATHGTWLKHTKSASRVCSFDGSSILLCSFSGREDVDQAQDNASFVRQAANSRPALEKLLADHERMEKALRGMIELYEADGDYRESDGISVYNKARQALAEEQGE